MLFSWIEVTIEVTIALIYYLRFLISDIIFKFYYTLELIYTIYTESKVVLATEFSCIILTANIDFDNLCIQFGPAVCQRKRPYLSICSRNLKVTSY